MKKPRKHYTPDEEVAILRRHLLEQEPVLKLCDELGLRPTTFYRWQKEFFANGAAAFQTKVRANQQAEQERIEYLEKKIQRKDEELAELAEEHVTPKKSWGTLNLPRAVPPFFDCPRTRSGARLSVPSTRTPGDSNP